MKTLLIIITLSLALAACNQNNKSGATADDTTTTGENQGAAAQQSSVDTNVNKIGTDPGSGGGSASRGQALISKSDCLTCHQVEEKLVGPSYREVAAKYPATEANKELLAEKIIKGGSGVWGEIAMAAHPNISKEDVREMVSYIMSLRRN